MHHAMHDQGLAATTGSQNDTAASPAAQFGDESMPKFNWRSLDDTYYDHIEQAEMTTLTTTTSNKPK
jgi:hypothetical protein